MSANLIYITVGSLDEAKRIAKTLVADRLTAGANIFNNVNSYYWWNGKIQDDEEVVLIAKTRTDLVSAVIEKVRSLHSYECPCIVSLPVADGYGAFLDWVEKETQ